MNILTLCGSIRASRGNNAVIAELAHSGGGLGGLIEQARRARAAGTKLSNTEILSAAAMMGALSHGAEVSYMSLKDLFKPMDAPVIDLRSMKEGDGIAALTCLDTLQLAPGLGERFQDAVQKADGVVLNTPVYFGDRSSVANKAMQLTGLHKSLEGKVLGAASVGAKRNGGQETCNIYALLEALSQGALGVGNGPPTSQYGGTAVGGHPGHVLDDEWGLATTYGVGRRVAQATEVWTKGLEAQKAAPDAPCRVTIIVTMDTAERELTSRLRHLADRAMAILPWADVRVHEVLDASIYRCLGCRDCPGDTDAAPPRCVIKDPGEPLEILREQLRESDGLIVAGLNLKDAERIMYRYQVLIERTRFLRHNDFELMHLLVTPLVYNQVGAMSNPIHTVKTITSYIRHNTILCRSVEILEHEGRILVDGLDDLLRVCRIAQVLSLGRRVCGRLDRTYETAGLGGGYVDPPAS